MPLLRVSKKYTRINFSSNYWSIKYCSALFIFLSLNALQFFTSVVSPHLPICCEISLQTGYTVTLQHATLINTFLAKFMKVCLS
jgi:hypothetical protein